MKFTGDFFQKLAEGCAATCFIIIFLVAFIYILGMLSEYMLKYW